MMVLLIPIKYLLIPPQLLCLLFFWKLAVNILLINLPWYTWDENFSLFHVATYLLSTHLSRNLQNSGLLTHFKDFSANFLEPLFLACFFQFFCITSKYS